MGTYRTNGTYDWMTMRLELLHYVHFCKRGQGWGSKVQSPKSRTGSGTELEKNALRAGLQDGKGLEKRFSLRGAIKVTENGAGTGG